MNGLTLIDAFFSRLNASATQRDVEAIEMIGSWLEQIVDCLVCDVNLLRRIDEERGTGDSVFDRVTFKLLYAEFERWAHQADAVLKRIAWLKKHGGQVGNAEQLDDRYGRTMARLQVTLDDMDEADAQFSRGEGLTIEEVRNELRAAARAKAQAGLAELEPWLQEETLDEIELLVDHADRLILRPGASEIVRDFVRVRAGIRYIVFVTIQPNHAARLVRIRNLGHFARPDTSTAAHSQP